jgi:hypothetical protein
MKVKELIAILQEANQDAEVRMVDYLPVLAAVSYPEEGTPGCVFITDEFPGSSDDTDFDAEYEEACLRG